MKLYMHAAACSLSPHIVCRELGLPIELVAVDRKNHRTPTGDDYLQLNGLGYVPALQLDDGSVITEGPAIVQHLADQRPDAGLAPRAGTRERTQLQTWLNFITSEIHKPLAMLMSPDFEPARAPLITRIAKRFDWLSSQLTAHGGPYLMGERFTVADPYLFVCLNWTQLTPLELAKWPTLIAFQRQLAARPAVQAALAAEALAHAPDSVFFLPEAMLRARQKA
jgi:glutathione S-transferase